MAILQFKAYIFEIFNAEQVAAEECLDVSGCDSFMYPWAQLCKDEHEDGCSAGCFFTTSTGEVTETVGEDCNIMFIYFKLSIHLQFLFTMIWF